MPETDYGPRSIQGSTPVPVALTIAGSDSSAGAGIQADLKTFSALRVYGMSVVTAITAQNSEGVRAVFDAGPDAIRAQMDAVMVDVPPAAVKVGMLGSAANVRVVADKLMEYATGRVILDPVVTSSSGRNLLTADGLRALKSRLFPLTMLLTPNLDEAEALAGIEVRSVEQMKEASRKLHTLGARHVLLKGGHLDSSVSTDVFYDGTTWTLIEEARIEDVDAHGSGCVLSAAITANLALGRDLESAIRSAKHFTTAAIRNRLKLGHGHGLSNPLGLGNEGSN